MLVQLKRRFFSSTIRVGGITGVVRSTNSGNAPLLIPRGYKRQNFTQNELSHLRWMLQKDQLKQDMFLLGPPTPRKRWLALTYCELFNKEVEYISLSSNTTESDLKQRREIVDNNVIFKHQPPGELDEFH